MSKRNTPSKTRSASPGIPRYVKTPHHPVGLLYSRLHHGPGLPGEEALSGHASHGHASHGQQGKAA
jgi:hypothetical protein